MSSFMPKCKPLYLFIHLSKFTNVLFFSHVYNEFIGIKCAHDFNFMSEIASLANDWNNKLRFESVPNEPSVKFTNDGPQVLAKQGIRFTANGTRQDYANALNIWKKVCEDRELLAGRLRHLREERRQLREEKVRPRLFTSLQIINQRIIIVNQDIEYVKSLISDYQ